MRYCLIIFLFVLMRNSCASNNDSMLVVKNKKNSIMLFSSINFAGNEYLEWINPTGFVPNGTGTYPYYWKKTPESTINFGVNYNRNIFIQNDLAIGLGIGLGQKSTYWKTIAYIDSNIYKPDLLYSKTTSYLIKTPISLNYFYRKFIFTVGVNLQTSLNAKEYNKYSDNSLIINTYTYFNLYGQFNESISFKLLKKTNLYVNIGGEHGAGFYKNKSYSNRLIIGLNFFFL